MGDSLEDALRAGVADVLAEQGRTGNVELMRIAGGASRETWLVEASEARFVLRRDPPASQSLVPQESEAQLIRLAAEHVG
jgi:aminoglycoside phosphotransferase (APT) family kinase protein